MNDIVTTYIDTWNAADVEIRYELLRTFWTEDCLYVDPMADVSGHSEVGAAIAAVQQQFPGFVFSQLGEADSHHGQTRFQWGLGPEGEEPVVIGFDVVVVDEDHRIRDVRGFLDKVPS